MTKKTKTKDDNKPRNDLRQPRLHVWPLMTTARKLDLLADFEIQAGHTARAEHFSRLAAEIRGTTP